MGPSEVHKAQLEKSQSFELWGKLKVLHTCCQTQTDETMGLWLEF